MWKTKLDKGDAVYLDLSSATDEQIASLRKKPIKIEHLSNIRVPHIGIDAPRSVKIVKKEAHHAGR